MDSNEVTLIVKAPNHQIADQTVECNLDWSIKKLKEHLSFHYPSKPKENEQRLIYLGKLLCDNICLHEVLKYPHDDDQSAYTVHLVCSPGKENSRQSQSNVGATKVSDNLRHRNVTPKLVHPQDWEKKSDIVHNADIPTTQPVHSHYHDMYRSVCESNSHNYPTSTTNVTTGIQYTPEQVLWFQHMYAQQMAQYMQYMQQHHAAVSTESHANNLPADNLQPNVEVQPQMNAGLNARPEQNNQQMIMNAAGGQAVFENEDDEQNRDWLDWTYSVCRFSVLIAIIYFYSTLGRFVLVFGFFFLIYLYQSGWFRLNRQVQRRVQVQEERPQEEQTPQDEAESENDESDEREEVDNAVEEDRPGLFRIAFSFVLTFFTSLLPQQPPAVNAN